MHKWYLPETERIIDIYHVTDLSQLFTSVFYCYKSASAALYLVLVSLQKLSILHSGVHSQISQATDGRVPVQDVFCNGVRTFQVRMPTAVDEADQTATVTDRLPSSDSYEMLHVSTVADQAKSDRSCCFLLIFWRSNASR